jgi:thioredoxin-related protein
MKQNIFDSEAFQNFAKDNLVLLELDFPQGKAQPDELKAQNEKLAAQYQVRGFPTVILLDPAGKELARESGYKPGGPDAFISWIEKTTK